MGEIIDPHSEATKETKIVATLTIEECNATTYASQGPYFLMQDFEAINVMITVPHNTIRYAYLDS